MFGDNYVKGQEDFKSDKLNNALQKTQIPITGAEPTKYYPFSHDEVINVIVPYVLNGVMLCVRKDSEFKLDPI